MYATFLDHQAESSDFHVKIMLIFTLVESIITHLQSTLEKGPRLDDRKWGHV
jgi:hypothetical protein